MPENFIILLLAVFLYFLDPVEPDANHGGLAAGIWWKRAQPMTRWGHLTDRGTPETQYARRRALVFTAI